jgi:hypothetical protein
MNHAEDRSAREACRSLGADAAEFERVNHIARRRDAARFAPTEKSDNNNSDSAIQNKRRSNFGR